MTRTTTSAPDAPDAPDAIFGPRAIFDSHSGRGPLGPLLTVTLLALAGCGGGGPGQAGGGAADGRGDAADAGATADDQAGARVPVCLEGGPFVADGQVAVDRSEAGGRPGGGEAGLQLGGFRWATHGGCERLVIDLSGPDGEPSPRAGEVEAEVLRRLGVVRIALRHVGSVNPEATETEYDGSLSDAVFAMLASPDRTIDVDVHLLDPAEARVAVLADPARVVVDLRPGGGPVPAPAPRDSRVVVLEPRPGPATYPLTIAGYARTFEANVVARLEHDDEDARVTFTTSTGWAEAWGHYSMTIEDGPAGPVRLHVGEHSARDGTWEGVAVDLVMGDAPGG